MSNEQKPATAKGKTSKFAQEAQQAAAATQQAASAMVLSLTVPADKLPDEAKIVRRNMPAMIRPADVPVGSMISGVIVAIVDSPVSTIKGKLLHLRHESGTEYTFPCTGVIRNALAPGKKDKELDAALEKEVGKTLFAKRLPNKTSQQYKKDMFMFDVFTSAK